MYRSPQALIFRAFEAKLAQGGGSGGGAAARCSLVKRYKALYKIAAI